MISRRMDLHQCTAVITGASSGLGAEFARQLAPLAKAIALVARREEPMNALAAELQHRHPALLIAVIPCDLADPARREELSSHLTAMGWRVNLLINNAGLGDYGPFAEGSWSKIDRMMQVNVMALTHLTHLFLPGLKTAAPAGILNVSSLAGELPLPDFAAYAAGKAFVTRFSEALRLELRPSRIAVCALCPGPVHTGFGAVAERPGETTPKMSAARQPAERVVRDGLRALSLGRARTLPGFMVRATSLLVNTLPLPILRAILSRRPRQPRPVS